MFIVYIKYNLSFWFILLLCPVLVPCDFPPYNESQLYAKQFMHTLCMYALHVSIHTYPRGSLIPETCSNGTLGRKQLKDSCEIQESNGNEVENVQ